MQRYNDNGTLKSCKPPKLKWATDSEIARIVCERTGMNFLINFVRVAVGANGQIYCSATAGKADEWHLLRSKCWNAGYLFVGLSGMIEFPPPFCEPAFGLAVAALDRIEAAKAVAV